MKNLYRNNITFLTIFALLFSLNKVEAQTGSGLDTLTLVNGWRLVEYAPGVTYAKTWFTNVDPYHGSYSQFFEVDRNNPDAADTKYYYATFKKNLPRVIMGSGYIGFGLKYARSKPQVEGIPETPNLFIAFGNKGKISDFMEMVSFSNVAWLEMHSFTTMNSIDSIDCVYLKISGSFKQTAIQVDYLIFEEWSGGPIVNVIEDFEDSTIVSIEDEPSIPTKYSLSQNYPNPFNPETAISYQISASNHVTLKVFDILGSEIETLVNEEKFPGEHVIKFDGSRLTSGMYIYQINIGNGQFIQTKKMVYLK